jgi:peroxiredoxin
MNSTPDVSKVPMGGGIGSLAPDFKLMASNGQEICLSDFRGKSNVVLFFIREYI